MSRQRVVGFAGMTLAAFCACALACHGSYTLTAPSSTPAEQFGPTGMLIPVTVGSDAPRGTVVTFTSIPSTIVVAPATGSTGEDGTARTAALVPYGTSGVIVASTPSYGSVVIPVTAAALQLCAPTVSPTDGGASSVLGRAYDISVQALANGTACADGGPVTVGDGGAPQGVPINITVLQPSATTSAASPPPASAEGGTSTSSNGPANTSASSATDEAGIARTTIEVPWGANIVVQATGGGTVVSSSLVNEANPVAPTAVGWCALAPGVYRLTATVSVGDAGAPAVPVSFSLVYPNDAGTISSTPAITNEAGTATAYLSLADAGEIVVQATAGTTSVIAADGGSNACN